MQVIDDPVFGFEPQVTGRTSPSFINAMYSDELFWDGRAGPQFNDPQNPNITIINTGGALENQAVGPILSSVEMAKENRNWDDVIEKLATAIPLLFATNIPQDMTKAIVTNATYPELFEAAFGDSAINAARIGMSIATYERTLVADQTPWDAYMAGNLNAMTAAQIEGWEMFEESTVCDNCHTPPLFTDNKYYNIGLRPAQEDEGRMMVTGEGNDFGRFRTPSLRNLSLKKSLMHVGWVTNSMDAIDFYNANTEDATSNHQQFTEFQTNIPTNNPNITVEYDTLSMFAALETRQALVADFISNGLTDPRVAAETFPFDRPTLASELVFENGIESIKVTSYNIRSQDWTMERADLVAQVIMDINPDIIALQEANSIKVSDLQSRLGNIYEAHVFDNESGPFLIKSGMFRVLESGSSQPNQELVCVRERYVNYLKLKHLTNNSSFIIFNNQFCAPQTSVENLPPNLTALQMNQLNAIELVSFITAQQQLQQLPVLVLGDLNAKDNSDTIDFLLEQSSLLDISNNNQEYFNNIELDDSWSRANNSSSNVGDWIMFSPPYFSIVSSELLDNETTQLASDHLPISTVLTQLAKDIQAPINSGLNGAWYNVDTSGQGIMLEVLPDLNKVFLGWFTYDIEEANIGLTTQIGSVNHRWLTGMGEIDMNNKSITFDIHITSDGLFDNDRPVITSQAQVFGSVVLNFDDCANALLNYAFLDQTLVGSIPITRIASDNISLCEKLSTQTVVLNNKNTREFESVKKQQQYFEGVIGDFSINSGLSGAWYNLDTSGQGFFFEVFPTLNQTFFAWFTYDTELAADEESAIVGAAGHRWLTGIGNIDAENKSITFDINVTSGGLFNSSKPVEISGAQTYGSLTITFESCAHAQVEYNLFNQLITGSFPLNRISEDNIALCEQILSQ
ncbi:MAG: endonuclease/exonuclease/phosphatase family protein [Alcanivoracaceae bacterium]|nr:endonuclease/exonuclease/phosphatase family protein [Alcanivoracaceae bacterium]